MTLLEEAMAHHRAGRHQSAARLYKRILEGDPENVDAIRSLGILALQSADASGAYELLTRTVALEPHDYAAHYHRGECQVLLRDAVSATHSFRRALELRPFFAEARIALEKAIQISPSESHWCRIVMYREGRALIESLHPETLDALEISGTIWQAAASFKSYRTIGLPEYDVCAGPTGQTHDLIILDQVLEHVRHPLLALSHVLESLRPGGHCFISTPFLVRVHEAPVDLWRWTERGLRCLLEDCGYASIQTGSWGNRECVSANFERWEVYAPEVHSLKNEPDFPVTVWALAQAPRTSSTG